MEVFIHIGHGKTGTSAIQSFLAKNRQLLLNHGIDYPEHDSFELAKLGKVSSGNGALLFHDFSFNSTVDCYLFSNEGLYGRLSNKDELRKFVERLPVRPIIICYTRDLFDYYVSDWGQSIKRGKGIKDIDEYAKSFKNFYGHLANYIRWSDELGYELIVKNYSNHDDNLIEHFCKLILDDKSPFFEKVDFNVGVVNRSLTESEYKVQQLFNKQYENKSSDFISDKLVNELPNVPLTKSKIRPETYELILENTLKDIDYINRKIENSEIIKVEDKTDVVSKDNHNTQNLYTFSEAQLEVLVEGIVSKINSI